MMFFQALLLSSFVLAAAESVVSEEGSNSTSSSSSATVDAAGDTECKVYFSRAYCKSLGCTFFDFTTASAVKYEYCYETGYVYCDFLGPIADRQEQCEAFSADCKWVATKQECAMRNPTVRPTRKPTMPTPKPTQRPTTLSPTLPPSTPKPTTPKPTTRSPTLKPTTAKPTTRSPTIKPTTKAPTGQAPTTPSPTTLSPTIKPSTLSPTNVAPSTKFPTQKPTTRGPTLKPTKPTSGPTPEPSQSEAPTPRPSSRSPTNKPTKKQKKKPTRRVTSKPTTRIPSLKPTLQPSAEPTPATPTKKPVASPSTLSPTTKSPSLKPTTKSPTTLATSSPTVDTAGYNIQVVNVDLPQFMMAAVENARLFWEDVITSDIPNTFLFRTTDTCWGGYKNYFGKDIVVDDLMVFVRWGSSGSDGPGVARAGPCQTTSLPRYYSRVGIIEFNQTVMKFHKENTGLIFDIVIHEMGHVLGLGQNWDDYNLYVDTGPGSTIEYYGQYGTEGFHDVGGLEADSPRVEDLGGEGTRLGHWKESVFGDEILTGTLNTKANNPVSIMTIKSLKDIGFQVDTSKAEAYALATSAQLSNGGASKKKKRKNRKRRGLSRNHLRRGATEEEETAPLSLEGDHPNHSSEKPIISDHNLMNYD